MPRPITIEDLYRLQHIEEPQFTPDGRHIAYVRVLPQRESNDYQRTIWLVARDGQTAPLQLTRGGKDGQPRWSPDGTTLAFVRTPLTAAKSRHAPQKGESGAKPQICLLPVFAPGGEARPLTSALNGASSPCWSPDGQLLAFLSPTTAAERAAEDEDAERDAPADALARQHQRERAQQEERERIDPRVIERIPYRQGTSYLDAAARKFTSSTRRKMTKSRPRHVA